ncbi:hypothetical protein SAMN04489752_1830 [Brevibacterium siliguriense]|uniref:MspA protein n=1 Tax=Brevibacterium siliguriense TaxID=1136497 RepID=A0A1H1SMK4_9MICO|nr:hypothetical protein [Brevibacterium siliguriense]SDS49254.1 hypothetical protein SAMN04489752_1830 [Brevibacterium siliguriense]
MLAAPPALADAEPASVATSSNTDAEFDQQLVNPADEQNYSLDFDNASESEGAIPQLEAYSGKGTVFSGSKKKRVGKGSARVGFSTGVVLNKSKLPTKVQFDGESQLCLSLPAKASSVSLTDKFTVTGAKISGTIGSGSSISGGATNKTVTVKHTKKKPGKKTCINNVNSGISFKGAIVHVKQQVTGVVNYKNTKYTIQVGDQ